jgi:hypothetical protein
LEGSIDGLSWTELDRRDKDKSLEGKGSIGSFVIGHGNRNEFGMIRLRQTGKNASGYDMFLLTAMEFFGVVKAPEQESLSGS